MSEELLKRLNDPSIKWYIWKHFGKRVYGDVSLQNQTLYLADDKIAIPVRFSEYFRWWDPSTNSVGPRIFSLEEAWDHVNESNPITSFPRNALTYAHLAYGGYFIPIELTNGSTKVVAFLVRKYNQILIFNTGYYYSGGTKYTSNIPFSVNMPPASQNMTYYTTGTVSGDTIQLNPGQYALFYPVNESMYDVDTTNMIFRTSPVGSNKTFPYELYKIEMQELGCYRPKFYLGIPSPTDSDDWLNPFLQQHFTIMSINRYGVNASSACLKVDLVFDVYDSDPYGGTWTNGTVPFASYIGYALDQNNKVKFILISNFVLKHHTRWQIRGETSATYIYDSSTDEWYIIGHVKPFVNMYSYGVGGSVATPDLNMNLYAKIRWELNESGNRVVFVRPDDSVGTYTSPATTTWEYTPAYGYVNVFNNVATGFEVIAFYTDDTITINAKDCRLCRMSGYVAGISLMLYPYGDRTLYAGKTYLAIGRHFRAPAGLSDSEYAQMIRKFTPRVLTQSEYNELIAGLPPFTLNIIGGAPHTNARYIEVTVPEKVNPGAQFTISGKITSIDGQPFANKSIYALIVDPETLTIVGQGSTSTDSNGNYTVTLQAPSTAKTYRVYILARP